MAKLSDGRANALPCPPLATPMHHANGQMHRYFTESSIIIITKQVFAMH